MKIIKRILKWSLYFLLIPIIYIIISLILTSITIDRKENNLISNKSIFLHTNGVHLDIVIPKENLDSLLLSGLKHHKTDTFLSFGWGEENFYINTPTWGDLTFKNAFRALFLKSETLMHVTRFKHSQSDWIEIKITKSELQKMNTYLINSFKRDKKGVKILLKNKGYSSIDNFYKSKGSYSCFKTCNSWVNTAFKETGLKSSLWTPFDFGLIHKYQ